MRRPDARRMQQQGERFDHLHDRAGSSKGRGGPGQLNGHHHQLAIERVGSLGAEADDMVQGKRLIYSRHRPPN